MTLKGKRILVDGYNLEMSQGSGIRRYGDEVLRQIQAAGGERGVLFSCPYSVNPVIQDAFLSSAYRSEGLSLLQQLQQLPRLWGARFMGMHAKAVHPASYAVAPNGGDCFWRKLDFCLTAPNCYTGSHHVWRMSQRPMKLSLPGGIDLMHLTAPLPLRIDGAPVVSTIHDLIPLRMPWATADNKVLFYDSVRYTIEHSDVILCISEHTKRDLLELFDVPARKIHLTYQPVPTALKPAEDAVVDKRLASYGLKRNGYLLFVGAVDPKKNLKRLLQALTLVDTDIPLVLVGPRPHAAWDEDLQAGEALRKQKRLIMPGYVPSQDLACLYQGCHGFLFPSLYEGFGLPPLEAMRFGRPVLTSNCSSLPEVCGDAAVYVDPFSVEDIAGKLDRLVHDEATRQQITDAIPAQLEKFSAEKYRERLVAAYEQAMG